MSPEEIVQGFRRRYANKRSCSVMLSRHKQKLKQEKCHDAEFLKRLCLTRQEYNAIREMSLAVRQQDALHTHKLMVSDAIVARALRLLRSKDPKDCFCGLVVATGLRPVEIVKEAKFADKLLHEQEVPAYWACQTHWAKRRNNKVAMRDRCFLAPFEVIKRAMRIVRLKWPCNMTNVRINQTYATQWLAALRQRYDMLPGVTARMLRRFFASFVFYCFPTIDTNLVSAVGCASHHLGHTVLADQVISYTNILLQPAPKLDIFKENSLLSAMSSATALGSSSSSPSDDSSDVSDGS